jgi:hypothetical protein
MTEGLEEWRKKAQSAGLDRLSDEHLRQLARAVTGLERQIAILPRDCDLDEEPAPVFRAADFLDEGGGR